MIVQPDFLDHWKTLKLASILSDPMAPIYIIRLWSYVQTSKGRDTIPDDDEMIKAVCRWPGEASTIRDALLACGWLDECDGGLRIHGWAELNARLIHNWTVGKTGGRPRVSGDNPMDNPRDNPRVSQTKPIRVDKIREDKIRENTIPPLPPNGGESAHGRKGRDSFKTWTREQLAEKVKEANADNLLTPDEVEDFIGYWTEQTATGRFKIATMQTWDTRRRMQNAVEIVYSKRRIVKGTDKPISGGYADPDNDPILKHRVNR